MPSLSYIKTKLPIIMRPLISPNHYHRIPINRSITPLITPKLWPTFNATKNSLLLNKQNTSFLSPSLSPFARTATELLLKILVSVVRSRWKTMNMNNKCYVWLKCLRQGLGSYCSFPRLALAAALWIIRVERVPFSDRFHIVLGGPKFTWIPSHLRNKFTYFWLSLLCDNEKYAILSSRNLNVVRVTDVVAEIVQGMHSTFGLEKESIVTTYKVPRNFHSQRSIKYIIGSVENHPSNPRRKRRFNRWYGTKHLEGKEWKVAVIDSPEINAGLLYDSTLYISTGMVNVLSHTELVTVLAHEFGHYIARHRFDTEWWSNARLLTTLSSMMLFYFLAPPYYPSSKRWHLFGDILGSIYKHGQELEADYIGLMLVASMGYDPRMAIKVYEKDFFNSKRYTSTHPSQLERIESLQNSEKMEKAMNAYRQAKPHKEVIEVKFKYN